MPRRSTIPRPDRQRSPERGAHSIEALSAAPRPLERLPIATVLVAVPARDEVATVRACLRSIDRAAALVDDVDVLAVVAADCCRDGTAERARSTPTAHTRIIAIEGTWRGPGAARAAAVTAGLATCGRDVADVWIASTDADCVVDDDWLAAQLRHASEGSDATAGIVRLEATAPARLRAEFTATYAVSGDTHHHVHAANLGVRAGAYLAVGGWSPHAVVGEDHNLWRRLRTAGHATRHPVDVVVTTSARTHSRVIGGFASALARLDERSRRSAVRSA